MSDLIKRAKIKAGMLRMGEPIAFGSDADIIEELIDEIRALQGALSAMVEVGEAYLPFDAPNGPCCKALARAKEFHK